MARETHLEKSLKIHYFENYGKETWFSTKQKEGTYKKILQTKEMISEKWKNATRLETTGQERVSMRKD